MIIRSKQLIWDSIVWNRVETRIRRSQERIYDASKKGLKKRLTFLQNIIINSLDAKLLAVRQVTSFASGKGTSGVDGKLYLDPIAKAKLIKNLRIDGKAAPIRRFWIPKPGKPKNALPIPAGEGWASLLF